MGMRSRQRIDFLSAGHDMLPKAGPTPPTTCATRPTHEHVSAASLPPLLAHPACILLPALPACILWQDKFDDAAAFEETRALMKQFNMEQSDQQEIFNVLAAIMHLGNISFFTDRDTDEVRCHAMAGLRDGRVRGSAEAGLRLLGYPHHARGQPLPSPRW